MLSELDILITFFPLLFISFDALADLRKFLGWCAVILAVICNVYQARLYLEQPLWWIPVGAFLSAFLIEILQKKNFRGLITLGALFVVQALLTQSLPIIVILLLFSDVFFCAEYFTHPDGESKNRAMQSLFRALLSFLPVAIGILLQLQDEWLAGCVAATIVLRLFSWPFGNWVSNLAQEKSMFILCVGAASSFALWRTQEVGHESVWAFVWIAVPAVLSLGAEISEMVIALSLGLFAISPVYAILGLMVWPLLVRYQTMQVLLTILCAGIGFLTVPVASKLFVEQAGFAVAAVAAIVMARAFARTELPRAEWLFEVAAVACTGLVAGAVIYFFPEILVAQEVSVVGCVFGGTLIVLYGVGKLVFKRKPGIFHLFKRISFGLGWTAKLQIREKKQLSESKVNVPPLFFERFLSLLESESYLALLLGALGAFLIWGIR